MSVQFHLMLRKSYLSVGVLILWGCQPKSDVTTQPNSAKNITSRPSSQSGEQSAALVDIPALLRMPIAQVKKKLGPPADDLQADVTNATHALVYKLGDKELNVDYIVKTGQVVEISFSYHRTITDFTPLYTLGKLNSQATDYKVDSLPSTQAGKFRGIIVSPNPPVEFIAE